MIEHSNRGPGRFDHRTVDGKRIRDAFVVHGTKKVPSVRTLPDAASAIAVLNATMELGIIRRTGRNYHIARRAYRFVLEGAAFDPFERKDT